MLRWVIVEVSPGNCGFGSLNDAHWPDRRLKAWLAKQSLRTAQE
jgi:hypothetical protein